MTSRLQWISLYVVVAGLALVPLALRPFNLLLPGAGVAPSYIPSVEPPRQRGPFDASVVATLRDALPDYYVIGDSMAGTRIDPGHMSRLVGGHGVASLLHPGTGSAYWYLVFKNYVVNAQIPAKGAIFFFRDELMTTPLFRLYPGSLDRVALEREPVLDRIVAANTHGALFWVHDLAQTAFQFDRTREWLEPRLASAPVPFVAPLRSRKAFLERMNTRLFALEALRPTAAADISADAPAEMLDFKARLPLSVLPEIIRLSRRSGIRVAFIRVQRRPLPDGPPPQTEAMARYVRDLEDYLRANGAYFRDERGDPDQPLKIYEDGDHIARDYRRYYTELFVRKNPGLFR